MAPGLFSFNVNFKKIVIFLSVSKLPVSLDIQRKILQTHVAAYFWIQSCSEKYWIKEVSMQCNSKPDLGILAD